jgi:hypothetical protein
LRLAGDGPTEDKIDSCAGSGSDSDVKNPGVSARNTLRLTNMHFPTAAAYQAKIARKWLRTDEGRFDYNQI